MTTTLDLVGVCKQIISIQQAKVTPQKNFFLYTLHGKTLIFFIFKKPFNIWNWLMSQNNSTVCMPDSTLESNNSDEKMNFVNFFILLKIELIKTVWFFGPHFLKFMEKEYFIWHEVDTWTLYPPIIVQIPKTIIGIVLGFWIYICPKLDKGT